MSLFIRQLAQAIVTAGIAATALGQSANADTLYTSTGRLLNQHLIFSSAESATATFWEPLGLLLLGTGCVTLAILLRRRRRHA